MKTILMMVLCGLIIMSCETSAIEENEESFIGEVTKRETTDDIQFTFNSETSEEEIEVGISNLLEHVILDENLVQISFNEDSNEYTASVDDIDQAQFPYGVVARYLGNYTERWARLMQAHGAVEGCGNICIAQGSNGGWDVWDDC